ncbi:MAG: DMT family transporter [Rhodanobacteraceae bacterium]
MTAHELAASSHCPAVDGRRIPDKRTRTHPRGSMRGWLSTLLVAWLLLLLIETLGQVAIKKAGIAVGAFELDRPSILKAVSTPWLWLGLACYLGQFAIWMKILEKSALSSAFPTSAIVFVAVMVASWAVFGDSMGWEKILGSAIIVAGILLLGSDAQPTPPVPARNDAEGNPP